MFQNDYIMREIQGLTRFLAKVLLQKEQPRGELLSEDLVVSGDGFFLHTLLGMVEKGEINQAENLLFEELDTAPRAELLAIAVRFYTCVAGLNDAQLAAAGFAREEIAEGLQAVKALLHTADHPEETPC